MNIKGSTGKMSRTIRFNLIMKGVIALHAGMQYLQPVMSPEVFGVVSVVLAVGIAIGNEYYRAITTGPLHSGESK